MEEFFNIILNDELSIPEVQKQAVIDFYQLTKSSDDFNQGDSQNISPHLYQNYDQFKRNSAIFYILQHHYLKYVVIANHEEKDSEKAQAALRQYNGLFEFAKDLNKTELGGRYGSSVDN